MSFLETTWTFISRKGTNWKMVRQVRRELFTCLCSVPFLHTYLGAKIGAVITASDSSNSGGAVGIAHEPTSEGKDYVAATLDLGRVRKILVLVISLFNGIGGALRIYDILGLQPVGMVCYEIHKPARWPHAEILLT